jgi:hypothetical protein
MQICLPTLERQMGEGQGMRAEACGHVQHGERDWLAPVHDVHVALLNQ